MSVMLTSQTASHTTSSSIPADNSNLHQFPSSDNAQMDTAEARLESKLLSLNILTPPALARRCDKNLHQAQRIEGCLHAGGLGIGAGDSGLGKSSLFCQAGLCVAAGIPFLGMRTVAGSVLYIDLENAQEEHKAMQDALTFFLELDEVPANFLMTSEAVDLKKVMKDVKPALVIIDSLRSFNPDADENNAKAGAWLKELREFTREEYRPSILLIHHIRKNHNIELKPKKLDDDKCAVREFMESMEGPRAFFNQVDTRIAIAPSKTGGMALDLKWNLKLHGDSELYQLERVLNDDGEPIGYKHLCGLQTLTTDQREKFKKLPHEFTFKEAKEALHLSDDPTNKLLKVAQARQILKKISRGHYRKEIERIENGTNSSIIN